MLPFVLGIATGGLFMFLVSTWYFGGIIQNLDEALREADEALRRS